MIKTCDWCNRKAAKLVEVKDGEQVHHICPICMQKHRARVCIDCGERLSYGTEVMGRCQACYQLYNTAKEQNALAEDMELPPELSSVEYDENGQEIESNCTRYILKNILHIQD